MQMSFYSGSSWVTTTNLSVRSGSSWVDVQNCYIYGSGSWNLCYSRTSGDVGSLDSFTVYGIGDPTTGNYELNWTYTATTPANMVLEQFYSFDSSSWVSKGTIDITTSPYTDTVEGEVGFTSLDNTYFKLAMSSASLQSSGSPKFQEPPYPS